MGLFDRMKRKQQESQARNQRLGEVGDRIGDMAGDAAAIMHVLEGDCENCGRHHRRQSPNQAETVACECGNNVAIVQVS